MRKPTLARRVFYLTASLGLALLISEVGLRILGFGVYVPPSTRPGDSIVVDPPGPLFAIDPEIGQLHRPGTQRIKLGNVEWTQTHDPDGTRRMDGPPSGKEVWAFGCSFTHGYGVSDPETFVARLQRKHPQLRFVNFGVDGASDIQMLLLFERELKHRPLPAWVIWGYLDEHEIRNVVSRAWRRGFLSRMQDQQVELPYGSIDEGKLTIERRLLKYSPLPGARWSALMNLVDKAYNHVENLTYRPRDVSDAVLARVAALCREHHIRLSIVYLRGERSDLGGRCESWGATWVDARLDRNDPTVVLSPQDQHPSSLGHQKIADAVDRQVSLED